MKKRRLNVILNVFDPARLISFSELVRIFSQAHEGFCIGAVFFILFFGFTARQCSSEVGLLGPSCWISTGEPPPLCVVCGDSPGGLAPKNC